MDKKQVAILILVFITGFLFGCNYKPYVIVESNKTKCDILLNKYTGQTWFNAAGYWERVTKDLIK